VAMDLWQRVQSFSACSVQLFAHFVYERSSQEIPRAGCGFEPELRREVISPGRSWRAARDASRTGHSRDGLTEALHTEG